MCLEHRNHTVDRYHSYFSQITNFVGRECNENDTLYFQVFVPLRTGKPANEEQVKEAGKALNKILNDMENYFLARGDFLAGNDITLADILGICEVMQVISLGYPVERNRPRMKRWMKQVKQRLQPHFDELHEEVMEFGRKYRVKERTFKDGNCVLY